MKKQELENILNAVKTGELEVSEAIDKIKLEPFTDIGYAKVDMQRELRQGVAEVIYGEGKNVEQIVGIVEAMLKNGQKTILITRLSEEKALEISRSVKLDYRKIANIGIVGELPKPKKDGTIVIATGGTSDLSVAEEAAVTAEALGNNVLRLYDVGVAGVHRLFANSQYLVNANVVIAIAGMEGALASVVGGMVDCPVIAVPTSVGYGSAFEGLAALLSMLNSCASGVSVVNIDNGFGAGYLASMINQRTSEAV